MPLPISVVLIASNEAHQLSRCLAAVEGWVTEIVVVINDCRDETHAVAGAHGARVVERAWTNFRDQKAFATSQAQQPWVLNLDADEVISSELRTAIEQFVSENPQALGAFARRSWFLGRWILHGDWYPDCVTRLYRSGTAEWSGTAAHGALSSRLPVRRLEGDLLHYPFPDIDSNLRKLITYTASFAQEEIERPFRISDVLLRPTWRFFRAYIVRGGFRDGFPGFFIAWSTAFMVFIKYSKLYENRLR